MLFSLASAALLAGCVSSGRVPNSAIGPMPGERPLPEAASSIALPSGAVMQAPQAVPVAPIALRLDDAVLMALENNRQLSVQRLQPRISGTLAKEEAAAFDPIFDGSLSFSRVRSTRRVGTGEALQVTESTDASVGVSEFLPTGTSLSFDLSAMEPYQRPGGSPFSQARAGVSVTQSLLRGFGRGPNLASLRQARLDMLSSEYELRGFAETLAADAESAYWDQALAQRQIAIFTESLALAERQLKQTEDRIAVGTLAPTERAAAQAEVARRREALIDAHSSLDAARLRLLRLLNPPGGLAAQVELMDEPTPPAFDPALEALSDHVALAMRMRPELNEARLQVQRGDLELVKTRNGLLPKLDFFAALGSSGYARSLDRAADRTTRGNHYDVTVGLDLEIPLGNRAARARHERATLDREQSARALDNLAQLVELDVRLAWIELLRAREQVTATAATRLYQQEVLRAEEAKFEADKSTSFLVAQAQRDLVAAQVQEVVAVVAFRQSVTDLYRLEGSLLERRRIAAPGSQPPAGL